MNQPLPRRDALKRVAVGAAALAATRAALANHHEESAMTNTAPLKRNINHSACKWCYPKKSLEELCVEGKQAGLVAIDLVNIEDAPTLKKHGIEASLVWGVPGGIVKGLNRLEHHDDIVAFFEDNIPKVAQEGYKRVICFSGNRDGLDDEQGLDWKRTGILMRCYW